MNKYIIYPKQFRNEVIPIEKNRCFVLMPFAEKYDAIYGTIKEVLLSLGFICNRDDEIAGSEPFMNKVITEILKSKFVIVILSDLRPNVLYELGIAHTFKDIQNVFIIAEKHSNFNTDVHKNVSDISHLSYFECNFENMILLKAEIRKFIELNRNKNDFLDVLSVRGLMENLSENNNDFVEFFYSQVNYENIEILTKILSNNIGEIKETNLKNILDKIKECIKISISIKNFDYTLAILKICSDICSICFSFVQIEEFVPEIIGNYFNIFQLSHDTILKFKTNFILDIVKNNKLLNLTMPWIIEYFAVSKSGKIDLNRYAIESFLVTTSSKEIDYIIINSIFQGNCYIREHMADIIGEKRM